MQPFSLDQRLISRTCSVALIGVTTGLGLALTLPRNTTSMLLSRDMAPADTTDDDRGSGRLVTNPCHCSILNSHDRVMLMTYRGSGRVNSDTPNENNQVMPSFLSWRGSGRLGQDGDSA